MESNDKEEKNKRKKRGKGVWCVVRHVIRSDPHDCTPHATVRSVTAIFPRLTPITHSRDVKGRASLSPVAML